MENSRMSLATVLSLVSISLYGFITFIGLYFLLDGDIQKSIIIASTICVVFLLILYILKKLKSVHRNFSRKAKFELFTLVVYIIVAVVTIIPFAHYFTIYDRKDEINKSFIQHLDDAKKMFVEYDINVAKRIASYDSKLNQAINGSGLDSIGFLAEGFEYNQVSHQEQKTTLMKVFNDNLAPQDYDTTKFYAIKYLDESKMVAQNWVIPFKFIEIINGIEKETEKWRVKLGKLNQAELRSPLPFNYPPIKFGSMKDKLKVLEAPSLLSIGLLIFLHVLILLPYFFRSRNSRSWGLWDEINKRHVEEEVGTIL